jgi:hypothetical protein
VLLSHEFLDAVPEQRGSILSDLAMRTAGRKSQQGVSTLTAAKIAVLIMEVG